MDALFDQVDLTMAAHPAGRLRLLRVRIGELAGVERELFRTAFDVLRGPRGHERATLELVNEEAVWSCESCAARVPRGSALRCERCGSGVALAAGGDIVLERIELEVPDV
jgi:Zn finger protein HypA/HybF involved in hydrogenase expression